MLFTTGRIILSAEIFADALEDALLLFTALYAIYNWLWTTCKSGYLMNAEVSGNGAEKTYFIQPGGGEMFPEAVINHDTGLVRICVYSS